MHQSTLDLITSRSSIQQLLLLRLQRRSPGSCNHPTTRQQPLNYQSATNHRLASRRQRSMYLLQSAERCKRDSLYRTGQFDRRHPLRTSLFRLDINLK